MIINVTIDTNEGLIAVDLDEEHEEFATALADAIATTYENYFGSEEIKH